jgi:hypothetical protein
MNSLKNLFETVLEEIKLLDTNTSDDLLREICNLVCNRLELVFVGIFFLNKPNELIEFRAGSGEAGKFLLEQGHHISWGANSFSERSIKSDEIWLISQPARKISKCPLPPINKMQINASLVFYDSPFVNEFLPHPLIIGDWQLSLPLRTQRGRFGTLWIYHDDNVMNQP